MTWLSWSTGKDSAFALHSIRPEVRGLLTTVSEKFSRVATHGVREALLEAQARRLGLELKKVLIPTPCSNEIYESQVMSAITGCKGLSRMAFGDLFLADVRRYREKMLEGTGIEPVFPLWNRPTQKLAVEMITSGLKAIVTCVDLKKLPAEFAGRHFDERFLTDLPKDVDPCGENGEFHTFVYDSPDFSSPIPVQVGEIVLRDGFAFADVLEIER